jgi:hypothetical protein
MMLWWGMGKEMMTGWTNERKVEGRKEIMV